MSERIEAYRSVLRDSGEAMLRAAPLLENLVAVMDVLRDAQLAMAEAIPFAESQTSYPLRTADARTCDCLIHSQAPEATVVEQVLRDAEARIRSALQ